MSDEKKPAKSEKKSRSTIMADRAKQRIEEQEKREALQHQQQLLRKRMELANSGVRAYERKDMKEAVKAFHTYIRILETWKGCPEGGLKPSMFDAKNDVVELLLISGIYWDLAKLYDRTETKRKEMLHYIEQFIVFSRGMPFLGLSIESLRKYIANDKPIHKGDFKNAYKAMGGENCFVATALIDVIEPDTLPRLRRFRDEVLMQRFPGRVLVWVYYRIGPGLARVVDRLPDSLRLWMGRRLDRAGR